MSNATEDQKDTGDLTNDVGKDDEELWEEIEAEESGTEAADKPAADEFETDEADEGETQTAEAPAENDLWANATAEQRAAFEAAQQQNSTLQHQLNSEKGRTKTFRRQLSDVTGQLDRIAAKQQPSTDNNNDDSDAGDSSDGKPESWNRLSTEYPEVAEPLDERLSAIEQRQAIIDKREREEAEQARLDHLANVEEQTRLLEQQHPDWLATADDPEFSVWLDDQPRQLRESAAQNARQIVDAQEAGDIITRFKASRSAQSGNSAGPGSDRETVTSLAEKRARQLESSTGARPRGPGTVVQGIPEDGDEEEIWKAWDRQEARENS